MGTARMKEDKETEKGTQGTYHTREPIILFKGKGTYHSTLYELKKNKHNVPKGKMSSMAGAS